MRTHLDKLVSSPSSRLNWRVALGLATLIAVGAAPSAHAQVKSCAQLRDEIASRLAWPKGSFRLEVVDKDAVGAGKTLGSCEGGARRVAVYLGTAGAAESRPVVEVARPAAGEATATTSVGRVVAALPKLSANAPAATPAPTPAPAPVESRPVASVAPEPAPAAQPAPAAAVTPAPAATPAAPEPEASAAVAAPAAVVSAALAASTPAGVDPREALLGSRIDTHVKVEYPASVNVDDKSTRITLTFDSDEAVQALGVLLARIGKASGGQGVTTALIDAEVSNASDGLKAFSPEPKTKLALPGLPTTWSWTLLPKEVGKHSLDIVLTANLPNAPPTVLTRIVKQVDVERTFAQSASEFFAKYWQWLSTTILLPLFGWFWKSRGRTEAKGA